MEKVKDLLQRGKDLPHDDKTSKTFYSDTTKLRRAKAFFLTHFLPLVLSMLTGLLSLMYIESIVEVLHASGKSHTPRKAFLRYYSTITHAISWILDFESNTSLKTVRKMHQHANVFTGNRTKAGRMTQFDMVLTQWAFVGPVMLFPEKLGVWNASEEEFEAYAHWMRRVGHLLGVEEDLNLCTGTLPEIREYCRCILDTVIRPAIDENTNDLSESMAEAMLNGVHAINPFIFPESFMKRVFLLYGCRRRIVLPLYSKLDLLYKLNAFVCDSLIPFPIFGKIFLYLINSLLWFNLYLVRKLNHL